MGVLPLFAFFPVAVSSGNRQWRPDAVTVLPQSPRLVTTVRQSRLCVRPYTYPSINERVSSGNREGHTMIRTLATAVLWLGVGVVGTLTYDNINDYATADACPDGTVATYSLDRGDWSRCVTPAWAEREQVSVNEREPYGGWDEAAQPPVSTGNNR